MKEIDWDSLTEDEKWDWAESIGCEQHFIDEICGEIESGKYVDPKKIAGALRLGYVEIPDIILMYAADLLEGKIKKPRGRPVDEILKMLPDLLHDDMRAAYGDLQDEGFSKEEAFEEIKKRLADGVFGHPIGYSIDTISGIVYPRRRNRS
ncbi:MAG: hypothetical protein AB9866_05515 [Syntrophobacteraceae bacterium]